MAVGAVLVVGGVALILGELGRDPLTRVGFWLGLALILFGLLYARFRRGRWY